MPGHYLFIAKLARRSSTTANSSQGLGLTAFAEVELDFAKLSLHKPKWNASEATEFSPFCGWRGT